jgi:hypothetical protein
MAGILLVIAGVAAHRDAEESRDAEDAPAEAKP